MISNTYITENWDYRKYQLAFQKKIESCISTRQKITACALFLATSFPKLPYFWGGGHECLPNQMRGLIKEWGNLKPIMFIGSENYPLGNLYPYSLDCSSFVSWCLINSDINLSKVLSTPDLYKLGIAIAITEKDAINKVQLGDLAFMKGHIGVVVDIDKNTKDISIVHISFSGQGINITKVNTISGLITYDDVGIVNIDTFKNRVGQKYFKELILLPY